MCYFCRYQFVIEVYHSRFEVSEKVVITRYPGNTSLVIEIYFKMLVFSQKLIVDYARWMVSFVIFLINYFEHFPFCLQTTCPIFEDYRLWNTALMDYCADHHQFQSLKEFLALAYPQKYTIHVLGRFQINNWFHVYGILSVEPLLIVMQCMAELDSHILKNNTKQMKQL